MTKTTTTEVLQLARELAEPNQTREQKVINALLAMIEFQDALMEIWTRRADADPKPPRNGGAPCRICNLRPSETCNICGVKQSHFLTSEFPTSNPDIGFLESEFPTSKRADIGNPEVKP